MNTVKAGKEFCELVRLCYKANCPLLVSGHHGIGKSALLEQAAKEMGISFISRDLSLMEPPDLIGLPKDDGEATIYLPPKFLPRTGKGLLAFEELNRCSTYMRSPTLQLLTARRLNDYELPEGWLPVAAINPADSDYDVDVLDPALLSRFIQAELVPDQQTWLTWGRAHGIHSAVLNYVASDRSIFGSAVSNPRAWEYVSEILQAAVKEKTGHKLIRTAVLGLVGDERGTAFLRTLKKVDQPLTVEGILDSYSKNRGKVLSWSSNGQVDLVEMTLHDLLVHLQPEAEFMEMRANRTHWNNLGQFLHDLPGDLLEKAQTFFAEREHDFPPKPRAKRKT